MQEIFCSSFGFGILQFFFYYFVNKLQLQLIQDGQVSILFLSFIVVVVAVVGLFFLLLLLFLLDGIILALVRYHFTRFDLQNLLKSFIGITQWNSIEHSVGHI